MSLTKNLSVILPIVEGLSVKLQGTDIYSGIPWTGRFRRVFGGQVVGQALAAAGNTVEKSLSVHSIHSYFIRPGDIKQPITYKVERTRDGKSFSTRCVHAMQDNNTILLLMTSFHKKEDSPFAHQYYKMPNVPAPEDVKSMAEIFEERLKDPYISVKEKHSIENERLIWYSKPIEPLKFYGKTPVTEPSRSMWVKVPDIDQAGETNNGLMHCCAAACICDRWLVATAALFNRHHATMDFGTSLDYSMWFHTGFKADDWLLFETTSPISGNARGLTEARLWKRDGTLAVTLMQESLIRGTKL